MNVLNNFTDVSGLLASLLFIYGKCRVLAAVRRLAAAREKIEHASHERTLEAKSISKSFICARLAIRHLITIFVSINLIKNHHHYHSLRV